MLVGLLFRLVFDNHGLINPTTMYSAASVLDCANLCRFPCSSFFYNRALKHQCALSSILYEKTHPAIESTMGWNYYSNTGASACSNESCYWFSTTTSNFTEAKSFCGHMNSHLAIITSESEDAFITEHLRQIGAKVPGYYLGATRGYTCPYNSSWSWENGLTLQYTNWAPDQPEDLTSCCLQLWSPIWDHDHDDYQWDDIGCYNQVNFICECDLNQGI